MTDIKPRWQYRFDNFQRAFGLLNEAIKIIESRSTTQLEKEGTIQRFEYTWELAWKTIKDVLEDEGVHLDTTTPKSVLKAAYAANVIQNGAIWMEALDTRNQMSHSYNADSFDTAINKIKQDYLKLFDQLHQSLEEKMHQND